MKTALKTEIAKNEHELKAIRFEIKLSELALKGTDDKELKDEINNHIISLSNLEYELEILIDNINREIEKGE